MDYLSNKILLISNIEIEKRKRQKTLVTSKRGGNNIIAVIVKLRANRQKTKDKLGPEIGSVMV